MADRAAQGRRNQAVGRAEEQACANLLALAGFVVWPLRDFGQARGRQGTRYTAVAPGVADLWAVHLGARVAVWWEVKSGLARVTEEQNYFGASILCLNLDRLYHETGDRDDVREWLIERQIIRDFPVLIQRRYPDVGRVVTRRRGR